MRDNIIIGSLFTAGAFAGSWVGYRLDDSWTAPTIGCWVGATLASILAFVICKLLDKDETLGPFRE